MSPPQGSPTRPTCGEFLRELVSEDGAVKCAANILSVAIRASVLWALACVPVVSCSDASLNLVGDDAGREASAGRSPTPDAQGTTDGQGSESGTRSDARPDATMPSSGDAEVLADAEQQPRLLCSGKACACDNGVDDDEDQLVDGLDPECTGAFDDDEASFATGIPGGNKGACHDCFFDNNSGHADDGCQYHPDCLLGKTPDKASESACFACDVSAQCQETCLARTPNGCDCFGCCEVTRTDGTRVTVMLEEACSMDKIDDETACPRCLQSPDCHNPCGPCELCPGKRPQDLADSCGSGDEQRPGYTCDLGEQVCGESLPCPREYYCHLGCCLSAIL